MSKKLDRKSYWRKNITIVLILLAGWFCVSCVLGIFLVERLNKVRIGGFPLGFWVAQQGSILVFILLILVYCLYMMRLDRRHHVDEEEAGR